MGEGQGGTFLEPRNKHVTEDCRGVSEILSRIGDKWTVLVVTRLGQGPLRFNEMRRIIGGISQRMLTLTLRGLERDGLVTRTVFPTIPPRVDYELTELGHSLLEPVRVLGDWARQHETCIKASRQRFDGTDEATSASSPPSPMGPRPSA